jgi:glutathione S-transferase
MRLWNSQVSGNCWKVRQILAHLDLPYERVELDVVDRSNRPEVLGGKNPALRVPTLELDDGSYLAESNAILWYFGDGTEYVPEGRLDRAHVLQWMFFEQYDVEPNLAVARFWVAVLRQPERYEEQLQAKLAAGRRALEGMERHLESRSFLVGERYSIADIALYAYTHVAEEGRIELAPYPAVRAWLDRVAAQPGHVTLDA